jgi:ADP-heptose:LPS heptosyltransferase
MTAVPERVLVVKLADIGDAVLALPAIQALRAALPKNGIDVLTTGAGANVFARSPAIDDVITMDKQRFDHVQGLINPIGLFDLARLSARLRTRRYDMVLLLHHLTTNFGAKKFRALCRVTGSSTTVGLDNGRGTFLTHRAIDLGFGGRTEWQYGLDVVRAAGFETGNVRPELEIDERGRQSAQRLLSEHRIGERYVVVHTEVGEFSPARSWPAEYFTELGRQLIEDSTVHVVLVGVSRHRPELAALRSLDRVVDLTGQTSFDELCAIVEGAALAIGSDSSVAHIAAAFDRPAIAIFGPSNVAAWKPYGARSLIAGDRPHDGDRIIAIHQNLPCSPCIYTGFRLGRPQGCRSRICMTGLQPNVVAETARSLIG